MVRAAVFFVVVFACFFAGRASVSSRRPPAPPTTTTTTTTTTKAASAPRPITPVRVVDTMAALRARPAPPPPNVVGIAFEHRGLDPQSPEGQVAALEEQWRARREKLWSEGAPVPWPEGHSAAVDQQKVVDATRAAIAARGLDADVNAVDCGEFPCIVHFSYRGSDADMFAVSSDLGAALGAKTGRVGACGAMDATQTRTCSLAFHDGDPRLIEGRNLEKRSVRRLYAYLQSDAAAGGQP